MTLDVLTWHVHGSYLYYLAQTPHRLLLPVREGRPEGYGGRGGHFDWPDRVVEVPAEQVRDLEFDVVLTQSVRNWEVDAPALLSEAQRRDVPRVHLEHDPPKAWPNDALHPVQDPETLLVHVTPFNDLMWDNGVTPTTVVQHGVMPTTDVTWTGELERGVTVVNNLGRRGRRLGPDVFTRLAADAPIDLAGMNSDEFAGVAAHVLGDVPLLDLHRRIGAYRCFVNPIRYTSMGLAVCEAMAIGLPVIGLATTEMAAAVRNGVDGYVDTDVEVLAGHLRRLLADRDEAAALSAGARQRARERFGIGRFAVEWDAVLRRAAGRPVEPVEPPAGDGTWGAAWRA